MTFILRQLPSPLPLLFVGFISLITFSHAAMAYYPYQYSCPVGYHGTGQISSLNAYACAAGGSGAPAAPLNPGFADFLGSNCAPAYVVTQDDSTGSATITGCTADRPTTPVLSCPSSVTVGQDVTVSLTSISNYGHQIQYGVDWTNSGSMNSGWSAFANSGTAVTLTKVGGFTSPGTYKIGGYAQDASGSPSPSIAPSIISATLTSRSASSPVVLGWQTSYSDGHSGICTYYGSGTSNDTTPVGSNDTSNAQSLAGSNVAYWCEDSVVPLSAPSCTVNVTALPPPTASISANPISITRGNSSTLTYSCTGATSASINQGIGSVSASGGTTGVSPSANTTYTLTCTNSSGSTSASITVAVTDPPISGSCSVSPISMTTGGSATWTASASGGNGTYTYAWSGTDSLTGTTQSVTKQYTAAGTKTASVTISSGSQSTTINCSNSLTVSDPTLTASCTVSPTSITTGNSAIWTASASGGNGTYTYAWSGTDSLTGTTQSVTKQYTAAGTKTASVTVSSNGQSTTAACLNSLIVTAPPPPPPASITATCNANGTAVSLSWPAAPGATSYNPRVNGNPIQPQCGQAGWQVWTDGTTCYPNPDVWGQTSVNNFPVNPGQTYSAYVFSTNANGTNWNSAPSTNFTCMGKADLIAGSVTPTNATAGVPVTLSATASNIGNASSGSFPVLFQVQSPADLRDSSYLAALAPNASAPASISYTFPAAGTYQVRACANYDTNWVAITPESDYSNNCGAWTSVNVVPPAPASISATCNANGTAVTLSWPAAPGATSYNPRVGSNPIQPQCGQAGWQVWTDGTTCYPNPDVWGQTTVSNFPVNPGQAYSAWVHSGNANGVNWSQSASTNFTCVGQSDLTAGSVTPTNATAGVPVTLSATASNIGNASSGSFPVLFQVQDSLGNNVNLTDSSYLPGLAPVASAPASISYTFASAGTYQVRACANYNTSWVAITPESNYGNNCGAWTSVTVATPPPTGALSCTVNNQNPTPGTTITYTVTPSNGATGPYTWNDTQSGSYGTGATASRLISSLGSYTMFVSGQNVVSQPVSCPVVTGGCASAAGSITAAPNRVRSGDTTTLSWSATGINASCVVSGPGVSQTTSANSCSVPPSSITTPAITKQSVYVLTCDGAQVGQVIVNVVPNFTEF